MPDPPGWSRGDFHIHTRYSDGIYTVRSIAEAARNRGLQAIIITDHDDDIPVNETRRIGRGINEDNWPRYKRECSAVAGIVGITVIPGVEFGRDEGHYLSYGLKSFSELAKRHGQNTINHVAGLGGFGYIAHPVVTWPVAWDNLKATTDYTGIEVWNAKVPGYANPIADGKWNELLQDRRGKNKRVFGIGNSDAHHIGEIGAVFNFTRGTRWPWRGEILKALQTGNVIFGKGPFLNFTVTHAVLPGGEWVPVPNVGLGETATIPYEARKVVLRVEWIDYNNLLAEVRVMSIESNKEKAIIRGRLPIRQDVEKGAFSTQVPIY